MSRLAVPYNIHSYAASLADGLSHGDRVHVRACGGQVTEEHAFFMHFLSNNEGIIVNVSGANGAMRRWLLWEDIAELWTLEEKPNIYYSDVPEVADVLKRLKEAVKKHVQANDSAGVLYLLDQVAEVKKGEQLLKEVREIIAGVRF